MVISKAYAYFSPEEYLEIEQISPIKHEYIQGQIYAMAGASKAHVLITDNLSALIKAHLRGGGCLSYSTDMKVRIENLNLFYYPDLVITCDQRDRISSEDFVRYPRLIIEVLPPKTEAFDRGDKFAHYKTLDTLAEYVLISQDQTLIEQFSRTATGNWIPSVSRENDRVLFASINFECAIAQIYEEVASLSC